MSKLQCPECREWIDSSEDLCPNCDYDPSANFGGPDNEENYEDEDLDEHGYF